MSIEDLIDWIEDIMGTVLLVAGACIGLGVVILLGWMLYSILAYVISDPVCTVQVVSNKFSSKGYRGRSDFFLELSSHGKKIIAETEDIDFFKTEIGDRANVCTKSSGFSNRSSVSSIKVLERRRDL